MVTRGKLLELSRTLQRTNMIKVSTLTALSTVLLMSSAYAAGFHLREQSSAAQGNAFAGATAGAENNSYAYFNVAGLTRQKGTQVNFGVAYIAPKASAYEVKNEQGERGADVQNIVHAAVSPNGTVSYQVNDKTFAGIALNVPYGMITKYDRDWAGSDHGITSDLKAVDITPMIAYKATDKLSVGAGLQIQYLWAHLTNSSSLAYTKYIQADGDALDLGYQLGALYEFTDSTRAGVGYRSEVKHKVKGKFKSDGANAGPYSPYFDALLNQNISVKITTPSMLSFGVYHDINERWAIMAEYQRVFWSSLQKLEFVSKNGNNTLGKPYVSRVDEKWRDTNFYAIGTSYMLDEQWKLRLGLAYDQSAVRFQHRTPRVPDSDRIWYSTGLGYKYSEKLDFDAGFTYIQAHDAKLDTSVTGNSQSGKNVTARYENSVKTFTISMNYAFN